jgi:pimeloyl-ACP methyl ester carboxylesterase
MRHSRPAGASAADGAGARGAARRLRSPLSRRALALHSALLLFALCVFALCVLQVRAIESAVTRDAFTISAPIPTPVLRFTPRGTRLDVVAVVAHGFSASKELMSTFGVELARQGITAYCFDFPGHGASTVPLSFTPSGPDAGQLVTAVDEVVKYALAHTPKPNTKLILIGHSLGTSAVGEFALRHADLPALAATILVSPVLADSLTTANPRNLLLLAEQHDTVRIVPNAKRLFTAACGLPSGSAVADDATCGDPASGTGRRLRVLSGLDHISILTSNATFAAVMTWLGASVDARISPATLSADNRIRWTLLSFVTADLAALGLLTVAAWVLGIAPAAGNATAPAATARGAPRFAALRQLGLIAVALAAGVVALHFWVPSPLAFVRQVLAVDFATYLLVAGLVLLGLTLVVMTRRGGIAWPSGREMGNLMGIQVGLALLFAVFLYVTLGALSTYAWASLALPPARLWRAGVLGALVLPFFLAVEVGVATYAGRSPGRARWLAAALKLASALLVTVALFAAIRLDPGRLSFLLFLLPILFILLLAFVGLELWVRRVVDRPLLLLAVAQALVLGWTLAATFPLLG